MVAEFQSAYVELVTDKTILVTDRQVLHIFKTLKLCKKATIISAQLGDHQVNQLANPTRDDVAFSFKDICCNDHNICFKTFIRNIHLYMIFVIIFSHTASKFVHLKSYFLVNQKFQNPRTTPFGRKVKLGREEKTSTDLCKDPRLRQNVLAVPFI